MFFIRLLHIDTVLNATSILAQVSNTADANFSRDSFSIITFNPSPRFFATLQMSQPFFSHYSVDRNLCLRMFIPSFRGAMLEGRFFPSMTMHFQGNAALMILRFESPSYETYLKRQLTLSSSQVQDLGLVDQEKFFSIHSTDFRRIIRELAIYFHRPIHATLTDSQVRFYIADREIVLTKEGGHCVIEGYQGRFEAQFQVSLRPMLFFINLSYQSERIWFSKTTNSRSTVICVPAFAFYAQYVIYFPQV
ncbi:uncharacterized protein LOC111022279 [Momordica charantia]|uniref:Uncharacterized protein LOC111022279 n=1 Tax=Momordica charantia TaxID=3673 RepID=A0A6J1DM64_MOMCH|nr:uncharacterized protein LOC111022279 [Momordica charantia]